MDYQFTIQAYSELKGDQLHDTVMIEVIAKNEKEAIKKAKKMTSKKHYRVGKVAEVVLKDCCQEKMFERLLKTIKSIK